VKGLNKAVAATLVGVLLACAVCVNNPDAAGQVLSGFLMGIGTELSGL
jgi:CO/xanthine dehydrogenase Mo-binding subunit